MKTAKVTNVQSNGTWQSPNGLMYKWDIDFDNGDHGQAMTKDQEHKTWVVNEIVSYTLEPNKNPQYPGKLTRIKEDKPFTPNQSKDPAVQKMIIAQSSLSSAVEFYKGSTLDTDDLLVCAKKFYDWVIKTAN